MQVPLHCIEHQDKIFENHPFTARLLMKYLKKFELQLLEAAKPLKHTMSSAVNFLQLDW